jgi:GntR family transcriptional regulator, transcriptional repressor for pyruvate dehydrogenase complex
VDLPNTADSGLARMDRPDPVSAEIARRLLDFLISGEVKVGERIPSERQLASALGIGRSAIREAIKHLQLLGLLDVRIGDGTYLREPDGVVIPHLIEWGLLLNANRVLELVEARRYVEVALAGLAAERRDEGALERMHAQIDAMRAAGPNLPAVTEAGSAFHAEIADAAKNVVLAGVMTSLRTMLRAWLERMLRDPVDAERSIAEHAAILVAIEAGNRAEAEAAMAAHLDRVKVRLREATAQPYSAAV